MRALSIVCSALLLSSAAHAARDIVLFGDSLSDDGNGYAGNAKLVLQTSEVYPQQPYYEGRWSNGPTWIEHAAKKLGSRLIDWGAAGATTGSQPAQVPPLPVGFAGLTLPTTVLSPNLFQQINSELLAQNGSLSSKPIYIVLIGVNDYFSIAFANTNATSAPVVANIERALNILYSRGAREFILGLNTQVSALPTFNHPDLYGTYPAELVSRIDQQVDAQNAAEKVLAQTFPRSHPGSKVTLYDWGAALIDVVQNAAQYGLTNLQDACYVIKPAANEFPKPTSQPIGRGGGTLCSTPQNHLFFDQFHPSAVAHQQIGERFAAAVGPSVFGVGSTTGPSKAPARGPVRGPTTSQRSPPPPRSPPTLRSPPLKGAPAPAKALG